MNSLRGPVLILFLAGATESGASGFFINQQSVTGLGRADAGNVAAANDLGTVFFNPAGMSALWNDGRSQRTLTSFGLHLIVPQSDLVDAGSTAITPGTLGTPVPYTGVNASDPADPTPVLNAYLARQLANDKLAIGFRLNSPFGLAAEYSGDWFGRYDSTKAELLTANIGAAFSYQVNDSFAFGAGLDAQYADSTLASSIPDPLNPGGPTPATDGTTTIEGDDWEFGWNIGLMFYLSDATRIGFTYRSGFEHDLAGNAVTGGLTGPLAPFNGSTGATATLNLPAIASIGIASEISSVVLYADYSWYEWSDLDVTRIDFGNGTPMVERRSNFDDTYTIAVGLDFLWTDRFTLRGGVKYDKSPTVDGFRDTTFADNDRTWITIGGTYRTSDSFAIDFALVHTLVDDAGIDIVRTFFDATPLASAIRTVGSVDSTVNTASVGIRLNF